MSTSTSFHLIAPIGLTDQVLDSYIVAQLEKDEPDRQHGRDKGKCHAHRDKYRFILDAIWRAQIASGDRDTPREHRKASLNFTDLEKALGNYTSRVLKNLRSWGIIERVGAFDRGKANYNYRLTTQWCYQRHTDWMILREHLDERMIKLRDARRAVLAKRNAEAVAACPLRTRLRANLMNLQLDETAATSYITFLLKRTHPGLTIPDEVEKWRRATVTSSTEYQSFFRAAAVDEDGDPIEVKAEVKKRWKKLMAAGRQFAEAYHIACCFHGYNGTWKEFRRALNCRGELKTLVEGFYTHEQFEADSYAIQAFQCPEARYVKREKGVRVDTPLTNMSTHLRAFLSHRDGELVNVDIANCQPLLVAAMLAKEYAGKPLPEDVEAFILLTQTGHLYEEMLTQLHIPLEERDTFKVKVIAQVFYARKDQKSPLAAGFEYLFPNVYAFILHQKRKRHQDFPIAMQKMEAWLMIDQVAQRLVDAGVWCSTIHDSVVCLAQDVQRVQEVILDVFQASTGLTPWLKEQALKGGEPAITDALGEAIDEVTRCTAEEPADLITNPQMQLLAIDALVALEVRLEERLVVDTNGALVPGWLNPHDELTMMDF